VRTHVLLNPSKAFPEFTENYVVGEQSQVIIFDTDARWIARESEKRWSSGRTDRVFLKHWDTKEVGVVAIQEIVASFTDNYSFYSSDIKKLQTLSALGKEALGFDAFNSVFAEGVLLETEPIPQSEESQLGILLIHIEAFEITQECIDSLENTVYRDKQIYLLENASANLSALKLFLRNPLVHMLFATARSSYCNSFNLLADFAIRDGSHYLFVSNNDTRGHSPEIFNKLISEIDNQFGMVSPVIYDFDHVLLRSDMVSHFGVQFSLATEAYVIPSKLWQEVDGFTNAFNIYCEDVDLLLRVRAAGKEGKYDQRVQMQHLQNGATRKKVFLRTYFYIRNVIWLQKRKKTNLLYNVAYFTAQESLAMLKWAQQQTANKDIYPIVATPFFLIAGIIVGLFTFPRKNKKSDLHKALLRSRWELKYKVR
jgi:GT2 family glycosyltransferase